MLQAHLNDPPPQLAHDLDGVFAKAMAKDREDRYSSAGALVRDLRDAIAGGAPATVQAPTAPHGRRRRRGPLIAAAALLLALAASALALLATRDSNDSEADLLPFVNRIENVLQQSANGRAEIAAALQAGLDCEIPPDEAARRIDSVADNRQSILQQLSGYSAPSAQTDELVTTLQQRPPALDRGGPALPGRLPRISADCDLPASGIGGLRPGLAVSDQAGDRRRRSCSSRASTRWPTTSTAHLAADEF